MFNNLSDRLSQSFKNIRGQGRLTEDNIKETLREVRMALLEADVALSVVREFVANVKARAMGKEVVGSLTPGQAFIKVVNDELVATMGAQNEALDLSATPPAVVLMAGLQGAGKTTTVGKLALKLKAEGRKVLVVSADVYRPAAIEQLQTLAAQVEVEFFPSETSQQPVEIAQAALTHAKKQFFDVLLVDTAGRLTVDAEMMQEIQEVHAAINPVETLFVVDAMTGQDAANTAKAFDETLPITGVVLTKTDGDARGGAALSIRHVTGKPIKFLGVGETVKGLDPFYPERVASRILGMGDVVSLVEDVQAAVDEKEAKKLVKKIKSGKGFDFEDLKAQFEQMEKMGGMGALMDKMPGMGQVPDKLKDQVNDRQIARMKGLINSMTPQERAFPDLIKGSRKRRIAAGAGLEVQDLNRLLKQYKEMAKMMKKMRGGGMAKMMRSMGGRLPPSGGFF